MPTWYLSFDREVAEIDPVSTNWRALSEPDDALTRIAKQLGVKPIVDFFSMPSEELASFLDEDDPARAKIPPKNGSGRRRD